MQTNELKLTPEMLLWKKLGITSCTMEFSCGGDSMNDTNFTFYKPNDKKGKNQPAVIEVECQELFDYFDNEVYRNVDFYEASDGHYIGESGNVEITLNEEDDDPEFNYVKSAQSEFSERNTDVIGIKLTKKEIEFINNYVSNINGGDGDVIVNYKKDFIMTDELEEIRSDIEKKIGDEASDYVPEDIDGELDEWYSFTTNDGDELDKITFKNDELQVAITNSFTTFTDSENY